VRLVEVPVKPRRYDASGRRAAARARRERVLLAAEALFGESGYATTTVAAIAEAADVSAETVYKTFGGKSGLVRALWQKALEGAGPVPAELRSDALRTLADPRALVLGWARLATEVAPRVVPVLLLVRDAAVGDPAMRSMYDEMEAGRLERMTDNARHLAEGGHLRAGVDLAEAADLLFAVSSPEMFELLVLRRGWSLDRYAGFVAATIDAALLPAGPAAGP
jgi:AcrR family transcriptional regulator